MALKLTQSELASRIGITQMHLSAIERGAKNASLEVARLLARELKLKGLDAILLNPTRPSQNPASATRARKRKAVNL